MKVGSLGLAVLSLGVADDGFGVVVFILDIGNIFFIVTAILLDMSIIVNGADVAWAGLWLIEIAAGPQPAIVVVSSGVEGLALLDQVVKAFPASKLVVVEASLAFNTTGDEVLLVFRQMGDTLSRGGSGRP